MNQNTFNIPMELAQKHRHLSAADLVFLREAIKSAPDHTAAFKLLLDSKGITY